MIVRYLYGSHEADWALHKDGWYEEKFRVVLEALGFEVEQVKHYTMLSVLSNVIVVAKKVRSMNSDALTAAAQELLRYSMVSDTEYDMWQVWCTKLEEAIKKGELKGYEE